MTIFAADDNTAKFCPDCKHYRDGVCLLWLFDHDKQPVATSTARTSAAWCGPAGSRWEQKVETDVALAAIWKREDD